MKLQLALDHVGLDESFRTIETLGDLVDIFEVGTPMIIREGLHAVKAIRARFPEITILADLKVVDGGRYESSMGFKAGADIVTVLGMAHEVTVAAVVEQARRYRRSVMVDLLAVPDIVARASEVEALGADSVCVHTASDLSISSPGAPQELERIRVRLRKAQMAVAGGITLDTVETVSRFHPDIVVVGAGIMKCVDRRSAASSFRRVLDKMEEG